MATETHTLDDRLRKRARDKLRQKLQSTQRELEAAIAILGTTDKITLKPLEGEPVVIYNRSALDQIIDQAFAKLAPKWEEEEIRKFMKEVDTLQDQLDAVYQDLQP